MPCDSSYSIKTDDDRVVLTVEQHDIGTGMDRYKATNNSQQQEIGPAQPDSTYKGVYHHPWDAILPHPASLSCSTHTTPQEALSDNECNGSRHPTSQCTAIDTATEPTPTAGNAYNVPTDIPMGDSIVDEITTQGLFDGLDELYDFNDSRPEQRPQLANSSVDTDKADQSSPKHSTPEVGMQSTIASIQNLNSSTDSQNSHTAILASQPLHKNSSRPNASARTYKHISLGDEPDINDILSALDEEGLADMSDDAANKIIDTLGGFSTARPSSSKDNVNSKIMGKVDGPGNKPQENGCHEIEELTDMSDTEAQCIIGDLGGFAKPKVHIKDSANSMAKHKSFERKPSKDMHQQPQSPSALSTSCVADRMSSDVDESVTQKTSNPFPSKKDVLSARRALRMDGGKTMTISFNTPTKLNGLEQPAQGGSRPQNQLRFKSPSLKRPAVRSQFSSPSKRLFISKDIAYNDSANTTGALRKSPARLLQFSKPFRSPARIANLGSVSLPQNPGSSIEQRPPPQLPPAIRKESIKPDERVLMGTPSCSIKQNSDEAADML